MAAVLTLSSKRTPDVRLLTYMATQRQRKRRLHPTPPPSPPLWHGKISSDLTTKTIAPTLSWTTVHRSSTFKTCCLCHSCRKQTGAGGKPNSNVWSSKFIGFNKHREHAEHSFRRLFWVCFTSFGGEQRQKTIRGRWENTLGVCVEVPGELWSLCAGQFHGHGQSRTHFGRRGRA